MAARRPAPEPVSVLRGHRGDVSSARFHASAELLFSGDADGEARVWRLQTRRPVSTWQAHEGRILHAHIDERAIVTQGRNGTVRVWDARLEHHERVSELTTGCYNFCRFDVCAHADEPPARWLVALPADDAEELALWELGGAGSRTCSLRRPPPTAASGAARAGMVTSVAFLPGRAGAGSGTLLAVGMEDGSVGLWDTRMAALLAAHRPHTEPVLCLAPHTSSPAAELLLLSGSADRRLCVLALPGAQGLTEGSAAAELRTAHTIELPVTDESMDSGGVNDLALRPDSKICASAGWDRRVRIFACGSWQPLAVLRHHTASVNSVAFSHCGSWLASAAADKTIALWSIFAAPAKSEGHASAKPDDALAGILRRLPSPQHREHAEHQHDE